MKTKILCLSLAVLLLAFCTTPIMASESTVTINVFPNDATITLGGVAQTATNGVAVFHVADGSYTCQVSKSGYIWQEGTLDISGNTDIGITLTEDAVKSFWSFDSSLEGWTNNNSADTLTWVAYGPGGALQLSMASNDPGITKTAMNIDLTGRDKVIMTYKNTATTGASLAYFSTPAYGYAGVRALTKTLSTSMSGYQTVVYNKNEFWSGTLNSMRIDPIVTAVGQTNPVFSIDKIEIPKIVPLKLNDKVFETIFNVSPDGSTVILTADSNGEIFTKNVASGTAIFNVSAGSYHYIVKKAGYKQQAGTVTVAEGVVPITVALTKNQYIYNYDFTTKPSVAQILSDGWEMTYPDGANIDSKHGLQTGSSNGINTVAHTLDEPVMNGKVAVEIEFMGAVPVSEGYFNGHLMEGTASVDFSFFITGAEGDTLHYKAGGINGTLKKIGSGYNTGGTLHTMKFVVDLDEGKLAMVYDGAAILAKEQYGEVGSAVSFSRVQLGFKQGCEFYWKSLKVYETDEDITEIDPVLNSDWIDYETTPGDFSLVAIPDMQYLPGAFPNTVSLMTQWMLDNKEKENIQYVLGLGDVVQGNSIGEWEAVKKRFDTLDGQIPCAWVPGNHDYEGLDPWGGADVGKTQPFRSTIMYNKYIPYSKVSAMPTFGGAYEEGKTDNVYHCFEVGMTKYMIMSLEFGARNSVLDWANKVVASHPDYNVIVNTHAYLSPLAERIDENYAVNTEAYKFVRSEEDDCNNGVQIWEKFASQHKNIFMVLSGHLSPTDVVGRVDNGVYGNKVYQYMIDGYRLDRGIDGGSMGVGMMFIMRFKDNGTKIDCSYYSAKLNKYYKASNQFTISRDQQDVVHQNTKLTYNIDGVPAQTASVNDQTAILTNGNVTATLDTNDSEGFKVITSVYKNGLLEKVSILDSESFESGAQDIAVVDDGNNYKIRSFIWRSTTDIKPLTHAYSLARTGFAKVSFTGAGDESIKIRNMRTNKTYTRFDSLPYGLYEYWAEKTGYTSQTGMITIDGDKTIELTMEEDTIKHSWDFLIDEDGFIETSVGAMSSIAGGVMELKLKNGAYVANNDLSLDVTGRKKLIITYKNSSNYADLQVQYKKFGSSVWSTYKTIIKANTPELVTTEIDLSGESSWTGILTGLRIGLITNTTKDSTIYLKEINIPAQTTKDYIDGQDLTFNITPNGALVTITNQETGKVQTRTVENGVALFENQLLGRYDYTIFSSGYRTQKGALEIKNDMEPIDVALEKDEQASAFRWNFDSDLDGFTAYNETKCSIRNENGCLVTTILGSDPYVYNPTLSMPLLGRQKVVIRYKNETPYSDFRLYYVTSDSGGYTSVGASAKTNMSEFDTMEIDLSDASLGWSGTLTTLRLDPVGGVEGMNAADFYVDSIEIIKEIIVNYTDDNPITQNIKVAKIFSDGMVLQRNAPVRIFGTSTGEDGSIVSATLGETTATGTVSNGQWEVMLPPMSENAIGRKLTVSEGDTSTEFNDVLVGDVYFASGQSNMAFAVNSSDTAAEAIANAKETDNIRFFYQAASTPNLAINPTWKTQEQTNPVGDYRWEKTKASNVGKLSAVAYNFAKSVQDKTGASVPIGIIQTAIGGTSLAENSPNEVNTSNNITHENGSYVYNTMIAPVIKYSAKGMLWYQGESDSNNDSTLFSYTDRFRDFVDYINNKNGNDLDILYVQLSSHSGTRITNEWQVAKFRAMQTQMLSQIPNASMIVSMDKGAKEGAEDTYLAHPRDKKILGERFADIVLYGKNSPMPKTIVYDETGATITFVNAGTGLSSKNGDLKGFELIVGNNAYEAVATITGIDTVRVEGATNPSGVRYGYYQEASQYVASLINSDDLPVPTFADGENANTIAPISRGVLDDYYLNYSAVPGIGAKVYGFDFSNDTQGFTATNGTISNENQALKFEPTQRDGMLTSQDLTMSSSGQMMKIRYKNTTNTHAMQVYFTTSTDEVINESKMIGFSIHSNMSDYADWYVNLGANTNWKDTITKIRIDPVDESSSGTIYIQSIEFYEYEPLVEKFWTFEETQSDTSLYANGWTVSPNGHATFTKENGKLKAYISDADAYMYKTVAIPAKYNKVKIKYKNMTTRSAMQVYFSTDVVTNKHKPEILQTNMTDFGEITVDMSTVPEWTGTIKYLRLDIANGTGTSGDFYIESVEVLK